VVYFVSNVVDCFDSQVESYGIIGVDGAHSVIL